MSKALDAFLAQYSREAREIALCLRALVLEVFPDALEQIDPKSGIIAYEYSKTLEGLVCAIAPHMKHVNLMFSKGAQLSDPSRLLEGTGRQARHVKLRSEAETQNPALRQLLEEALKLTCT
ncbi:MAG: DUF1801 domain-containing protein [Candidatus Bathyarchaeia archaeon]